MWEGASSGVGVGTVLQQRGNSGPFQLEDDLGVFQGVLTT